MRCQNPECQRTISSPSVNTKETGLCGSCRKKITKETEIKNRNDLKLKPNLTSKMIKKLHSEKVKKAESNAIEKFEASLKNNPKYYEFVNMFRDSEKVIVK